MRHFMVDLETMGNGNRAAIVSLGAVAFDLEKLTLGEEFYEVISLRSAQRHGLLLDADTVMWWLQQAPEAQRALYADPLHPPRELNEVLKRFAACIGGDPKDVAVWGNGATFDNVILRSAFEQLGIRPPWTYKGDLCFRTLRRLFPVPYETEGTKHNALDDARGQAKTVLKVVEILRKIGEDWTLQGGLPGEIFK